MRVTNYMSSKVILDSIQRSYESLAFYQRELSSGKRIMAPSDDPPGSARVGWLEKNISQLEQYKTNIDMGLDEMRAANDSLVGVTDIIGKVKQIATQANNSLLSQDALNIFAYDIEELLQNLLSTTNTTINNKYVFSGFQTDVRPFVETAAAGLITAVDYFGDTGQRVIEVAANRNSIINYIGANTPTAGGSVFPPDLTVPGAFIDGNAPIKNIFTTLINLRDDLLAGNLANLQTIDVPNLSNYTQMLQTLIGMQAVRIQELESLKETHATDILYKITLKASIEEADLAEVMSNLSNQQVVYEAALQAGAKIMTTNLFDYLR